MGPSSNAGLGAEGPAGPVVHQLSPAPLHDLCARHPAQPAGPPWCPALCRACSLVTHCGHAEVKKPAMSALVQVPKLTLAKLAELDRKVRPAADASLEEAAGDAKMGDAEVEDSAKEDSAKGSFGDPPASPALSSAGGDTEPVAAPPAVRRTAAPS